MKKRLAFPIIFFLCVCLCACMGSYEESERSPISWEPVYNAHNVCGVQASRALPEGTVKRELTEAEIAGVLPETLLADSEITGNVYFKPDKSLYYMSLQMKQGAYEATILLGSDVSWGGCCLSVAQEGYAEETCSCGDVIYALFRSEEKTRNGMLLGHGKINGIPLLVRMHANDPDNTQPVFENILEDFVRYKQKKLDISRLRP